MAYNVKYRGQFKDHYGVDIIADIMQDGWPVDNITEVRPTGEPLSLSWPGERDDIFNPVRGGVAAFSFYAETAGQFNEFFDANNKEYKLRITKDSLTYWEGFLTLEDYQEALAYPPYEVTVRAYDLGFLQNSYWDKQYHDDDTILDVIYRILAKTYLDIGVVDRVNIYEDSISNSASDCMLDLINMKPTSFFDDNFDVITDYEALQRLLIPFNAFIMQENNAWNICRVGDMRNEHNYRVYAYPQLYLSSGAEDLVNDLSDFNQIDRSALLMACPNYRKLNFTQDYGIKNIVNNGLAVSKTYAPTYYWDVTSGNGSMAYASKITSGGTPTVTYSEHNALVIISSLTRTTVTHEKTYEVYQDARFNVNYGFAAHRNIASSPTCTTVSIIVKLTNGASTYYLNMSNGSWSTSSSVSNITFSSTANKYWTEDSFETEDLPIDGTLSIALTEANWSGLIENRTYFSLNLTPAFINGTTAPLTLDYSETIDSDSFNDLDLTFYYGDSPDDDSLDICFGTLAVASGGAATDSWQSNAGSVSGTLIELAKECYRAQYESPARRLQCTLKGDLDYLTVLNDSENRRYLASSITRDFRRSELQGEWIEIKTGWGDDLVDTWINGAYGSNFYEGFTDYGSYLLVYKVQTSAIADITLDNTPLVEGVRYKITADIGMIGGGAVPNVYIGGTRKTDLIDGYNEWEIIADTTEDIHYGAIYSDAAEDPTFTIALTVQEAYGI